MYISIEKYPNYCILDDRIFYHQELMFGESYIPWYRYGSQLFLSRPWDILSRPQRVLFSLCKSSSYPIWLNMCTSHNPFVNGTFWLKNSKTYFEWSTIPNKFLKHILNGVLHPVKYWMNDKVMIECVHTIPFTYTKWRIRQTHTLTWKLNKR